MKSEKLKVNNGWKQTTLGEVAVFNYGKGLPTENRKAGDVPVYGSSGITGFHSEALIDEPGYIIGRKGTVGSIHYSNKPFYPIDTVYYLTKQDIKCDFRFFYYLLQTLGLDKLNFDSAVPGLNRETAYSLRITIPATDSEQKAIAAVLSSFDDKIELLRRQNKTLESIAQTIFREWFVNFNFPDQNGKPYKDSHGKMKSSELGEIPEGWKVGTVNDVIERFSITYRCDKDDLDVQGKTPIIDQGSNGLYGYTQRQPDFLASTENPVALFANHTCNMWFVNYPFCAIQNIIPFRGRNGYDTFFAFYMTYGQISFIENKGHWPDFEQKEYVIPPVEVANEFSKRIKPLQYKMWKNNSQIQTLSKLRDTLLPKLMKGEIRVKELQKLTEK